MKSGAGLGILLILVTPVILSAPAALMTAELASAIPAEGGYYVWVRRAMGPFWGFLCGWWTWAYSWVDVAIYPGLFADYVDGLTKLSGHPLGLDSHPWLRWGIGMAIIVPFTWMNIRGTKLVGESSVFFGALLLAPFVVMIALGLPRLLGHPAAAVTPFVDAKQGAGEAFSAGLFAVMWNYLGWDSMSTVAGEVENPQRNFPRALAWGVPLVAFFYLVPAAIGIVAQPDLRQWDDGSWPEIAKQVAGPWLGDWIAVMGLISAAGLFSATLLAGSRIPFAIAEDKRLPRPLTRLHPRFGTPWIAILVSAAFYAIFSYGTFGDLAILDVVLYSSAITLEFVALLALRRKEPGLPRPYRIPGGWPGAVLVAVVPTVTFLAALESAVAERLHQHDMTTIWLCVLALASGPAAYAAFRPRAAR